MSAENTDNPKPRSIHVNAIGKVLAPSDKAELTLSVEAQAKTVESARNQSAAAMTAVIKALKNQDVADRDIQTRTVSLFPTYSQDTGNKIGGYQSINQVNVTIRDLNKASAIIDGAIKAGGNATRLQGIGFSIAYPEEALAKAREKAYTSAKAKAEHYAKLADVSLDSPLQITEVSDNMNAPIVFSESTNMRAAMADRIGTPVQSGEQEIAVTLDVVFGIH